MKDDFCLRDRTQNEKQSWCSIGRGIHQRNDPLLFLIPIGVFIYAIVMFGVVIYETITR